MRKTRYADLFFSARRVAGFEVTHENNRLLGVRGDKADPSAAGNVCPKASAIVDAQHDPDRRHAAVETLRSDWSRSRGTPLSRDRRTHRRIQERHGNDAVAYYRGNPLCAQLQRHAVRTYLAKALRTPNR